MDNLIQQRVPRPQTQESMHRHRRQQELFRVLVSLLRVLTLQQYASSRLLRVHKY